MKTIEEMKSFPAARKNYRPEKVEKLSEEQMKWFRDAKFGMFIHWGVYSMLGKGEWVLMNEHLDVSWTTTANWWKPPTLSGWII